MNSPGDEGICHGILGLPESSEGRSCGRTSHGRDQRGREHTQVLWPPSAPTFQAGRDALSRRGHTAGQKLAEPPKRVVSGGQRRVSISANHRCPAGWPACPTPDFPSSSPVLIGSTIASISWTHQRGRGQRPVSGRACQFCRNYTSVTKNLRHQSTGTMESRYLTGRKLASDFPFLASLFKTIINYLITETIKYRFQWLYLKLLYKISLFDVGRSRDTTEPIFLILQIRKQRTGSWSVLPKVTQLLRSRVQTRWLAAQGAPHDTTRPLKLPSSLPAKTGPWDPQSSKIT